MIGGSTTDDPTSPVLSGTSFWLMLLVLFDFCSRSGAIRLQEEEGCGNCCFFVGCDGFRILEADEENEGSIDEFPFLC